MYRLLRWVGCPSAFQDPLVKSWILGERLTLAQVEAFRRYEYHLRVSLSPGAERTLGPSHGFSRTYVFTPEAPYQWMLERDAALLMQNRWDRWEFLDHTDAPGSAQRVMRRDDWRKIIEDFSMLRTTTKQTPMSSGDVIPRVLRP